MIRSYDPIHEVPPAILRRIPILTTLPIDLGKDALIACTIHQAKDKEKISKRSTQESTNLLCHQIQLIIIPAFTKENDNINLNYNLYYVYL